MGVTYRGIAIGGPDDGKTLEHRETVLKRLSGPLAGPVSGEVPEETGVVTYYFTSITTFSHADMLKRAGQLLHQAMREGVPGRETCEAIIGILNRIERELED